jgi:oligo-1,6-glucosidase/alpha-glucosidase
MVGDLGWHYDDLTEQWYWAQFLSFQPDLNYRNPEVKKEMLNTVRFWLEKGVDGFRLDIINTIFEDEELRDNPFTWKLLPSEDDDKSIFQHRIHTINHPDNFQFVKELRGVLDEFSDPERFLVGEVAASLEVLKKYSGEQMDSKTSGLHMTFQFQSLDASFDANEFRDLIRRYEAHFPEPYTPTWVFSNHDKVRRISMLGNNTGKAKLNATLQLTARGVPFIYYGEEIGISNHQIPLKAGQDPIAQKTSRVQESLVNLLMRSSSILLNRDNCRTPMQWNSSPNAGFCPSEAEPWLPIEPRYEARNVKDEEIDPNSLLLCYKELLRLRRNTPALHFGTMHLIEEHSHKKQVLAYERRSNGKAVQIWLNFSSKPILVGRTMKQKQLLFSTFIDSNPLRETGIHLEAYQGIVLE